jgi:hypothetical protein
MMMETMTMMEPTDATLQVETLRAERMRLLEARREAERAPVAPAEARARLTTWLDMQAARWPRDAAALAAPFASPAGLSTSAPAFAWQPLPILPPQGDPGTFVAFMVHVLRPQLEAVLLGGLESHYAARTGAMFTSEERAQRLAELDEKLHACEVAEEQSILLLESRHMPVSRRADADPDVVMSVFIEGAAA